MKNEFNKLKGQWQASKADTPTSSLEHLVMAARRQKRNNLFFHYGNIVILTVVLVVISWFFYFVTPFEDLLSKVGVFLMVGGLGIRILIEIYSTIKSRRIDYTHPAAETTHRLLEFYRYRKMIHKLPTIFIVSLYTLGFYMLTPEFSKYLSVGAMILIDGSYIIGAIILIWQIRKGLRKEMRDLQEVLQLHESFSEQSLQSL